MCKGLECSRDIRVNAERNLYYFNSMCFWSVLQRGDDDSFYDYDYYTKEHTPCFNFVKKKNRYNTVNREYFLLIIMNYVY